MNVNTLILGAGAAGLMCAAHAGADTLVIDHAKSPGEKIRISGGGRCNFTNLGIQPERFLSENPHFAKSTLSRYTQWDFLDLVERHGIAWHEKTLGQLFCDGKATQIVDMLLAEMAPAQLWLRTEVGEVSHDGTRFRVVLTREGRNTTVSAQILVLATGGLSIPKMGATGLAYRIASQFGHGLIDTRAGLVPFTFSGAPLDPLKALAGVAAPARVICETAAFDEALLFTHRGLSGPAVLQISSYWSEGQSITLNLDPEDKLAAALRVAREDEPRRDPATILSRHLPQRLVAQMMSGGSQTKVRQLSDSQIEEISDRFRRWKVTPSGTEGYRTAEVTLGGIDTAGLSSKTMESRHQPGLFAIGEAVDVTGWLGGYNFQWAWSSGWAAGQEISARH
ncbi:HI0933-like protein [Rhodobacteraceae bacterium THAF1]|uniref:NAD(P)/FAD-dependent oxidoreductase n=1 Tax=Palleronia sp. THAF1 TaxID=2587842 RepID=UPI000F415BB1|nr:NAD(P)/FAD-dependent oxidoreductase [Palleronia sp. THAF1]QFU09284.1 HI0933-like protein [Palleronia sp. THAF1]VDC26617.1 HI0933-like protein [Rhodobacteraceae bacterium THAF1]